ncbi:hypothetical protein NDU88_001882 [Pleurodeles waltl]|uniref:Uncharacterized protein n=1 Tax=Pleurodeles waltl TaxID=8319 RepID=A0AAV7VCZ6_PLEWA|nr:hypothetical protein NDU88_001882 [Pleurodeles waltl]
MGKPRSARTPVVTMEMAGTPSRAQIRPHRRGRQMEATLHNHSLRRCYRPYWTPKPLLSVFIVQAVSSDPYEVERADTGGAGRYIEQED